MWDCSSRDNCSYLPFTNVVSAWVKELRCLLPILSQSGMVWFISTTNTRGLRGASELRPFLSDPQHDTTVEEHLLFEAVNGDEPP